MDKITFKEDEYENKRWYKNSQLHRAKAKDRNDDLPVVEYTTGGKEWYQNGQLHRDNDLPAIEFSNGTNYWYKKGKLKSLTYTAQSL